MARAARCGPGRSLARSASAVLEALRVRLVYRALDAVLTAPLRPSRSRIEDLRGALSPRSSYYERVASLTGCIDSLLPGAGRRAARRLLRPGLIPFSGGPVDLLGSGSGSTVFHLPMERGRYVLKVYRRTIGRSAERLVRLAAWYRQKHRTVSSWYPGPFSIVAPAGFVVLHGPLLARPGVACLQPYIEGMRGFFEDLDEGEQVRRLEGDAGLKDQFCFFARRTLEVSEASGCCPDLLGSRNLVVTGVRGNSALKLIDYGIIDLRALNAGPSSASSRISKVLSRLKTLLDQFSPDEDDR